MQIINNIYDQELCRSNSLLRCYFFDIKLKITYNKHFDSFNLGKALFSKHYAYSFQFTNSHDFSYIRTIGKKYCDYN